MKNRVPKQEQVVVDEPAWEKPEPEKQTVKDVFKPDEDFKSLGKS